jgi:hypothetical protein
MVTSAKSFAASKQVLRTEEMWDVPGREIFEHMPAGMCIFLRPERWE